MTLSNTAIISFAAKVAQWHILIKHSPTDKRYYRFYGFNHEELLNGERSKLNFDKLILGLSLPGFTNVNWTYKDTGTASLKYKYFDIVVVGKFKAGDYDAENSVCENAETVLDELEAWLYEKTNDPSGCDWPLLEMIDTDNIQCRRIQDIGIAEMSGAQIRIAIRDYVAYNPLTNPLANMTP